MIKSDDGKFIYFGSYPQAEVRDNSLKETLTGIAGNVDDWAPFDYDVDWCYPNPMKFKDVEYNGDRYRGLFFTHYRSILFDSDFGDEDDSFQFDNGYFINTVYWFKFEPVMWKVLSEKSGEMFVISDKLLDSQYFCILSLSNKYKDSAIKEWLEKSFCKTAFNSEEISQIKKISLPDIHAAMSEKYGFEHHTGETPTRVKIPTDYAKVHGANASHGVGSWWLKSSGKEKYYEVRCVAGDGSIFNCEMSYTDICVAPTLKLIIN